MLDGMDDMEMAYTDNYPNLIITQLTIHTFF